MEGARVAHRRAPEGAAHDGPQGRPESTWPGCGPRERDEPDEPPVVSRRRRIKAAPDSYSERMPPAPPIEMFEPSGTVRGKIGGRADAMTRRSPCQGAASRRGRPN